MEISTLVFLDMESTGLPANEPKCRITELCMVAVQRKEFLQSPTGCCKIRVQNKLSLCFYPKKPISAESMRLTGLDNENLLEQHPFDQDASNLIKSFLQRLPAPVCLVAHNGVKFDFPLLRTELQHTGVELDSSIVCCDSFLAVKEMWTKGVISVPIRSLSTSVSNLLKNEGIVDGEQDDETSPDTSRALSRHSWTGSPFRRKISYKLSNLYDLLIGEVMPNSHSAEGDCLALMKVCQKFPNEFCCWFDGHSVSINSRNIGKMW